MTERWKRIERLLESALELEPEKVAGFLDGACAGDEDLRSEIESLIANREKAFSFFAEPAFDDGVKLFAKSESGTVAERRIGAYRIIREIGHGGMGTVYLATRADDQFKKRVAIKLLRRGMDTEDILRRFRNERQILASLDHTNIARLLDGGMTDDGLPYLVMEYIEGDPIDIYCDDHRLATTDRLRLFRKVCSAVQYAHQNLVIHRDIKPGNILVTQEGEPKLLDFGIAKIINPELASQTLVPTETAIRLMTPDYASPEQVRGKKITTSSDIYSLGVLLYKLLTGHHPYRFDTPAPQEIERVICEREPEKPSTAISRIEEITTSEGTTRITPESVSRTREGQPEKLRRRLRGDIDNIILMAMRKEPERRYPSVEQFSEDIHRHLEGLPVIAHKDTLGYRASKFIKRNKVGVAATALIVLTLIASFVAIYRQSRVAAEQRDKAQMEAAKAESINDFLQKLISTADPSWYVESRKKGPKTTIEEALSEAARRIESEMSDQPEIKAELHHTIGNTYRALGLFDEAEKHFRSSLELRGQILGDRHPQYAVSLYYLGAARHSKGDLASAEKLYREAIAIFRASSSKENVNLPWALLDLAGAVADRGDYEASESARREAVELFRERYGEQHAGTAFAQGLLGQSYQARGDFDQAIALYERSLETLRQLFGGTTSESRGALLGLGFCYMHKGEYAKAEALIRQYLSLVREQVGDSNPGYAQSLPYLAELLLRKGELAGAEAECKKTIEVLRKSLSKDDPRLDWPLNLMGRTLTRQGKAVQGEPYIRESLKNMRSRGRERDEGVAGVKIALGESLMAQKRYGEAEPLMLEGYRDLKASQIEGSPRTNEALKLLVQLYEALKKPDQAARYQAMLTNGAN